jgi:V/A-type H+-transporting ATPase subunit I
LGVEKLAKVTLVLPRSELSTVIKELVEFEWFHPIQPDSSSYDSTVNDLALRISRLFVDLDNVIKDLNLIQLHKDLKVKLQPEIIEMLTKGIKIKKEKFFAEDWKDFVAKTEAQATPILHELRFLIDEISLTEKSISDHSALKEALRMVSKFSIDLGVLTKLRRFHILFTIVKTKDVKEIKRSLPEYIVTDVSLTKSHNALLTAGSIKDAERLDKVLKSFEVEPFKIPKEFPQNPKEAFFAVANQILEYEKKYNDSKEALKNNIKLSKNKLVVLYEAAQTANFILRQMRKSGDLKRVATVEGYIPSSYKSQLEKRCKNRWMCIFQGLGNKLNHEHEKNIPEAPTLFSNKRLIRSFQFITMNQGAPTYGEIDPTPIISIIFPIFYGIMFGDLGHGLILLLAGLLFYKRGNDSIKGWGVMFALAGISASIVGIMIGEAFGFSFGHLFNISGYPLIHLIEHGSFNTESVVTLLQISFLLGIAHIIIGLLLNIINGIKEKEYTEIIVEKIPKIILYMFGVFFAISFVNAGYSFDKMFVSQDLFPILQVPISDVASVSTMIAVISIIIIIIGRPLAIKLGKFPKQPIGMVVMMEVIETLFERIPGYLANTVSYARIAILLIVHTSLLYTLNLAVTQGGITMVWLVILCNPLIIILEGMIVYIQTLRLHVYEWFTKFYDGTGISFIKLKPKNNYIDIEWK